jgi:hypothetical protein
MSAAAQSIRLPAQGYILRVGKSSAVGAAVEPESLAFELETHLSEDSVSPCSPSFVPIVIPQTPRKTVGKFSYGAPGKPGQGGGGEYRD